VLEMLCNFAWQFQFHFDWQFQRSVRGRFWMLAYPQCQFNKVDRVPTSTIYFGHCFCLRPWVSFWWKLCGITVFCQFCLLYHCKVVCVYTPGEVDSFNMHCPALIAAAACQIWLKFINNFYRYSKKLLAYFYFLWTRCILKVQVSSWPWDWQFQRSVRGRRGHVTM